VFDNIYLIASNSLSFFP